MDDPKKIWNALKHRSQDALGDEFWQDISSLMPTQGPRVDLYQTQNHLIAVVELPGLASAEQIKLSLSGQTLYIRGEIPCDYPEQEEDFIFSERFTGKFQRKVKLPQDVQPYSIQARYRNGLLHIHMEKKPEDGEWSISVDYIPDDSGGYKHG